MNDQILLSPQVKRIIIIIVKHGILELPHKSPYDLIIRILGIWEISITSGNFIELLQLSAQSFSQNENCFKNLWKIEIEHFPSALLYKQTRVAL